MATMNISLPDQMKAFVEAQSADGKYANSSDYIRDLIRRDAEKRAKIAALQDKIDEAYEQGFIEIDDIGAFFDGVRKRAGL